MGFERAPRQRGRRIGFSDVDVGTTHRSGAYEVEIDEVKRMSAMWDPWEFHLDDASATESLFEGATASGIHTLAISNLLGHDTGPDYDRPRLRKTVWWLFGIKPIEFSHSRINVIGVKLGDSTQLRRTVQMLDVEQLGSVAVFVQDHEDDECGLVPADCQDLIN